MDNQETIILLSGGVNSTTLLFDLVRLKLVPVIEAMVFVTSSQTDDYNPARANAARAGVPFSLWNLGSTDPFMDMSLEFQPDDGMDPIDEKLEFVQMLLSAGFRAKQRGCTRVVTGHLESEIGFSGEKFADTFALVAGYLELPEGTFEAPYWHKTKAEVFWQAKELGVLGEATFFTTSCLEGDEERKLGSCGFGCGECAGCVRRLAGWEEYLKGLKK